VAQHSWRRRPRGTARAPREGLCRMGHRLRRQTETHDRRPIARVAGQRPLLLRALSWRGGRVFRTSSTSQGSRLKSCSRGRCAARAEEISVRVSAASLKKSTLPSRSTVITPSSRLARTCSHEISVTDGDPAWRKAFMLTPLLAATSGSAVDSGGSDKKWNKDHNKYRGRSKSSTAFRALH